MGSIRKGLAVLMVCAVLLLAVGLAWAVFQFNGTPGQITARSARTGTRF